MFAIVADDHLHVSQKLWTRLPGAVRISSEFYRFDFVAITDSDATTISPNSVI